LYKEQSHEFPRGRVTRRTKPRLRPPRVLRSSPRSSAAASSTTLTVLLSLDGSTIFRSSAFRGVSSASNLLLRSSSPSPVLSLALFLLSRIPRAPEYHGLQRSTRNHRGYVAGSPDRSLQNRQRSPFPFLASQSAMDHSPRTSLEPSFHCPFRLISTPGTGKIGDAQSHDISPGSRGTIARISLDHYVCVFISTVVVRI